MGNGPVSDQPKPAEPIDSPIEAALREYLERLDRGELVDREEFLERRAPIAEKLRSLIAAEDERRKLAGAEAPLDRAHDSTKSFVKHDRETLVPQPIARQAAETSGTGLAGKFGRYQIIREIGKGAMGTVYLAEDTHIGRQIALKTPHFKEDPTGEQAERFFREARAAGNLRHPNICPIHDFGQIDGKHFISMAYIEGRPLSAFIRPDKPQTERQILIVVRKAALALQEAHDHGIVHRDLKPANIMVDKKSEPIIMDFGLARQTLRESDIRLTQTGNIIGTPAYMSPEQVGGEPDKIGPPTDQYSLGVILYELLTCQLPFRGSVMAVMSQVLTSEPPPPSQLRSDLDPRIEAVCLKMMAKKPSERFASLKAATDELAIILKRPNMPVAAPGPSPVCDRMQVAPFASEILKALKPKAATESDLVSLEEWARTCLARRDYDQVIQVIERIPKEQRNTTLVAMLEMARAKAEEIAFMISSLEELARTCLARRDYDQVIQVIERIPEEQRNAAIVELLEKARGKADEISLLTRKIDEADRLNDSETALKKAEELLKINPGNHRALDVQEKYSGYSERGAARVGPARQFTESSNEGRGRNGWGVLALGLAAIGVMAGAIVLYLERTAVVATPAPVHAMVPQPLAAAKALPSPPPTRPDDVPRSLAPQEPRQKPLEEVSPRIAKKNDTSTDLARVATAPMRPFPQPSTDEKAHQSPPPVVESRPRHSPLPLSETEASSKLAEKGVHVTHSGLSLVDEKELARALAETNTLKRKMLAAAKEQQAVEQQIEELQVSLRERMQNSSAINTQLVNPQNTVIERNQLNALAGENVNAINLLLQEERQSKKECDVLRKKCNAARETYVQQVADVRALVGRISERYAALKADPDAQSALSDWNSATKTSLEFKPSSNFLNSVKKLELLEKAVDSEKIPLRRVGNSYYATVVINGKAPKEMIVDTGASSVVLPYRVAVECGVNPGDFPLTLITTIADGSRVRGKPVVLDSVRVGKFTAKNVECVVWAPEEKNAPMLLGMTYLSRFNFSINGTELVLSRIVGGPPATKAKTPRASKRTPKKN